MDSKELKSLAARGRHDIELLANVIDRARSGNSLLFVGAGFSIGSTNIDGDQPPLAKDLSRLICKMGGFDESDDLAFSSDFFLERAENAQSVLIDLLRRKYTIKEVQDYHVAIASLPWRRVYTTNYDNCLTVAATVGGKQLNPITVSDDPISYARARDVCVHINGQIGALDKESLERDFKLTESSYVSDDAFRSTAWAYRFKKDLALCTQIVFIGYSMADMEVSRLLLRGAVREKVVFVSREDLGGPELFRLSKYGQVVPIGVERFAQEVIAREEVSEPIQPDYLTALQRLELPLDEKSYSDANIRDFLLNGSADIGYFVNAITSQSGTYLALRRVAEEAIDILKNKQCLVVHSGFANGKTVVLQQISSHLLLQNQAVYVLEDEDGNYESDIEKLAEDKNNVYLIVDAYARHTDLINYFVSVLGDRGKVVVSERTYRYERTIAEIRGEDLTVAVASVDYLDDTERTSLVRLLDSSGLWGGLAGRSQKAKEQYIESKCESQISAVLLDILEAPQIKNAILDEFNRLAEDERVKRIIYTICVIQSVGAGRTTRSAISDVDDSLDIFSKEVTDKLVESGMFGVSERDEIKTRSSVFGMFLMREAFSPSYAVDRLVAIASRYQLTAPGDYVQKEIRRATRTFAYLALVLPKKNRRTTFVQFYDKLKAAIPRQAYDPHYWLQYAMAVMSYGDLATAQRFLKQSYGMAERLQEYDTTYIDNQQAKLYLLQAIEEVDSAEAFDLFKKAAKILNDGEADVYKYRQANFYVDYYEKWFKSLSKKNRNFFKHTMKRTIDGFDSYLANRFRGGSLPTHLEKQRIAFYGVIESIHADEE